MSSNVIGQQDGSGKYIFSNLDNKYGGATTELVKLEEGKVTIGGGDVVVDSVTGVSISAPLSLTQPLALSYKSLALATGDTTASLTIDADVVFIDNANTSSCTVTVADGTIVGAVAQIVCTATGTVVLSGPVGSGGGLTITAKGGTTLVCGPDLKWHQIGLAA